MKSKARIKTVAIFLALASTIIAFQSAYADNFSISFNYGKDKYYRHHRYYPRDYYFHKKVYFYPRKRSYYYYDVFPEKVYYFENEKPVYPVNPAYLPVTSIANMASQGVPDAVIIAEIERTHSVYNLTSEVITYLRQNGVNDRVIDYMLDTKRR